MNTAIDILRFAVIRDVPFSKHLANADEVTLACMVGWGWLQLIDKPHGRCAWQVTRMGKDAYAGIERLEYENAVIGINS